MVTAGIDIGAKTVKVVLYDDTGPLGQSIVQGGLDTTSALDQALAEALTAAGLAREDIAHVVATGAGRQEVSFADDRVTEVTAAARGASFLVPTTRTVIDVGAEEGRAVRCGQAGKVEDFAVNEKCAAGAGAFTEAMARALEVDLEELGKMSLRSTQAVPMNAQCTVFAESEVVSLLHAKTPKEDISRAVHDAMASRIVSMVRKVGFQNDVVVIGGMARNVGFVDSLQRNLETEVVVPESPDLVGALGAALIAAERAGATARR
jgi:predicted CoA-substrate-specific enzyme activase